MATPSSLSSSSSLSSPSIAFPASPCSPPPVWCVCGVRVAPGWSIPRVCPSSGVATAVHVTMPKGAIVSRCTGPT
ncbi:hypothetical protein Taro_015775 [Colocasia esculenta]|uniref:Uncharacterized protein n=1 Tax=Colocasia esculenta TaxID=4460 RepID=A0A843UNC2_COLES|nr:hypothetical protein [Colocasia esculenta]